MEIPQELSAYLQIVEDGGVKHIACRKCGKRFFAIRDAARHLAEAHGMRAAARFYQT
ncbi:hypothetical protein [Thermoproteus tenax]|uniref:C2H2 Zn finger protein n=1 Tax=Thermoproteus tenax (strain ATCC 35583 / DSM 2078 / JCM 9277 / NBRC 100435 / Kra 1) TaxID=768679 RepID=G4RKE9_THETK|nr:hypothetical protein [Thermoproteus tenax]CCC82044.1 C2H2 Zn finger protein [Thermoproteus tenax Kra 1]